MNNQEIINFLLSKGLIEEKVKEKTLKKSHEKNDESLVKSFQTKLKLSANSLDLKLKKLKGDFKIPSSDSNSLEKIEELQSKWKDVALDVIEEIVKHKRNLENDSRDNICKNIQKSFNIDPEIMEYNSEDEDFS